jgi:hypothetical protein
MASSRRTQTLMAVVAGVAMFGASALPASAAVNDEAFEFENFHTYRGKKDGVFSVSHAGRGGGRCDGTDQRYVINLNRSYPGSDWKIFSNNSRYQRSPSGRTIYGFQLDRPGAHICVGAKDFFAVFTRGADWNIGDVARNVYAWRR